MDQLLDFCEFQHYGLERGFILPCREFAFISLSHLVILLYTTINLTQYFTPSPSAQIFQSGNRLGSLFFALTSASSSLAILCQIFIPFDPHHRMPVVLLMAYSMALFIWLGNAIAHAMAFIQKRHLALLPFIPSVIPILTFLLISTQRWISFGLRDPRTLLTFSLLIIQTVSALLPILNSRFLQRIPNEWNIIDEVTPPTMQNNREENQRRLVYASNREESGISLIGYIFSELFFCWTNPLLRKGYHRELKQVDDVFELPASLDLHSLEKVLPVNQNNEINQPIGEEELQSPHQPEMPFFFAPILLRVYCIQFLLLGFVRLIGDIFKFASPILLHLLITSLQNPTSFKTGYICSGLMFFAMFFSSLCDFHFNFQINMLNIRAKTALLLAVYQKLLRIPVHRLTEDFSSGKLINLMCTDVDRIGGFITSFHAFWSMPMNFGIALYLVYREIGLAFLAGLAASIALIPLNKYIATKIGQLSNKMMQMKDERMKLVSELTHSMRTVKLNNWEPIFETKINTIRTKELAHLRSIKYLDAICVYLWASAPIIITVLMLVTYTSVLHEQLTAAKVFTTLALINILIMPLNAFPWVLSSIINGLVSKRRFDSFFAIKCANAPASEFYAVIDQHRGKDPEALLELKGNSFGWGEDRQPAIENVNFIGKKGKLIGIVGPVGSGKSTLLLGLLGETTFQGLPMLIKNELLTDGFAYVGQDVWLRAGTIRQNILCERPFQAQLFQTAIECCALQLDIQRMPNAENYRISGEGITLSGGQKVRLALARALYADKQVYLLDDPFAALDRTVAHFVNENYVEKGLRAREKLVILCTHHEEFLLNADLVIRLDADGKVEKIGSPKEVLTIGQSNNALPDFAAKANVESNSETEQPMDEAEFVGAEDDNEEENEEKEEGAIKIAVYRSYIGAMGQWMAGLILLSLFAMQCSKNGSDIWLSRWASSDDGTGGGNKSNECPRHQQDWNYPFSARPLLLITSDAQKQTGTFYLSIYVAIAAFNSLFTLLRAFLFAFGCILAARRLHHRLLGRIMLASISWWDRTPYG